MRTAGLDLTKDDITAILEWAEIVDMDIGLSETERTFCRYLMNEREKLISPRKCTRCGYDEKSEWHTLVCYSIS